MLGIAFVLMVSGVSAQEACPPVYERPCDAPLDICTWTTSGNPDNGLPLGSGYYDGCPLLGDNTDWPIGSELNPSLATATCVFDGDSLDEAMLYVSINNDIIHCTLNQHPVFENEFHEGCAPVDPRDGFSTDISDYIDEGTNTLICEVQDRGVMTHFDACVVEEESEPEPCEVIVLSPNEGEHYDPLWINWTYEGACIPSTYTLQYGPSCEGIIWDDITTLPSKTVPMSYWWDPADDYVPSGEYCIRVRMDQGTGIHVSGYSGIWYLDLTPPEVSLSVGDPKIGDCTEEGEGDCYVNTNTDITLTCSDGDELWQSGVDYIEYRYRVDDGSWTGWYSLQGDSGSFSFSQDSNHELEYRCFDKVGKPSETKVKEFIVDTQAPNLDRTVGEPKMDCGDEICVYYVNTETDVCLFAEDDEPHPVGMGEVWCEWWYGDNPNPLQNHYGPFRVDTLENGCFNYEQDSYHTLRCWAEDDLGNTAEKTWFDIVDSQAPETTLTFEGPYHSETEEVCTWEKVRKWRWWCGWYWVWVKTCETISSDVQWIDGVTTVVLEADDQNPHPVGLDKIYYRYELVNNEYCLGTNEGSWQTTSKEAEGWSEYATPFTIDESCHVIEYYSVDLLGNSEDIKHTFVFVDHTPPETIKEVGEPSSEVNYAPKMNWYENPNQNIEWEVTLDTPVTISCGDIGPHPSGINGLWYRVVWDGKYNDTSAAWKFESEDVVTIWFAEKSEHLLEFYCVDNVNKTSETDSELFKVKGTAFDLEIGSKWDLVSVPFQLIGDGKVEEVFSNSNIVEVWSYENGQWKVYSENVKTLTHIIPGRGYWIRATEDTTVLIGGELYLSGGGVIPIAGINLEEGWNLIGHYGTAEKTSYCSLFRLVDGSGPLWRNLLGYNPDPSVQNLFEIDLDENTEPGRGYWIDMTKGATYRPSSICY